MPTPAERIQLAADIDAAQAIDPAAMVRILDEAIAFAVTQGDVVVSYTAGGNTVSRSLEQARALREYYQGQVDRQASGGGFIQAELA